MQLTGLCVRDEGYTVNQPQPIQQWSWNYHNHSWSAPRCSTGAWGLTDTHSGPKHLIMNQLESRAQHGDAAGIENALLHPSSCWNVFVLIKTWVRNLFNYVCTIAKCSPDTKVWRLYVAMVTLRLFFSEPEPSWLPQCLQLISINKYGIIISIN